MASMANTQGASPRSTNSTALAVVAVNAFLTSSALPARRCAQSPRRGAGRVAWPRRGRRRWGRSGSPRRTDSRIHCLRGGRPPVLGQWSRPDHALLTPVLCREAPEPMHAVPVDPAGESSRMGTTGTLLAARAASSAGRSTHAAAPRGGCCVTASWCCCHNPVSSPRREWCTRAGQSADVPTDWSQAVSLATGPQ